MKLLSLMVIYALVGAGAVVALLLWRDRDEVRVLDALLLLLLWPLYGPFLLARLQGQEAAATQSEVAFLAALRRARHSPLADFLPDEATARDLARRLRVASQKVAEIDDILTRPEFCERDARRRLEALHTSMASEVAISTARMRIQNICRLRALRDRSARDLEEVTELLTQLKTQVEVMRLSGTPDAETRDLVQELVTRVESIAIVLEGVD